MLEKKILILLAVVNFFAFAGILIWFIGADREAPVITVKEGTIYTKDITEDEILASVSAWDEQDGDVSSTLKIEKIVLKEEAKKVLISCGAQDKSGNIQRYTFSMSGDSTVFEEKKNEVFELAVGEAESMLTSETQDSSSEAASTETVETDSSEEETTEEATEENTEEATTEEETTEIAEEESEEENNAEEAVEEEREQEPTEREPAPVVNEPEEVIAVGRPELAFSAHEVTTARGFNPAWVTVIAQLQDDTDSYEQLLRTIKIHGNFDNETPGTYAVSVTVTDSQGNESLPSAIYIIVE